MTTTDREQIRALVCHGAYGDRQTFVIGHRCPDVDAVGAAIAYAGLLRALGIPAIAAMCGAPNAETRCALARTGLTAPVYLDHVRDRQIVLVDHSQLSQSPDGAEAAEIVGIVEHYGIQAPTPIQALRLSPVGATTSLVYQCYLACEVPISADMARAMLIGLLSDTACVTKKTTPWDFAAWDGLRPLSGLSDADIQALWTAMREAALSYEGMTDEEIFLSDYKAYALFGHTLGIGAIKARDDVHARELAARMQTVVQTQHPYLEREMLFALIKNCDPTPQAHRLYMVPWGTGARELLEDTFHALVLPSDLSRKLDILPALQRTLAQRADAQ